MSYQTDDPSLSWFVIPTVENYYTTYTDWLKKQNCSEELILRFEKTSMKLDRTMTIKNKVLPIGRLYNTSTINSLQSFIKK